MEGRVKLLTVLADILDLPDNDKSEMWLGSVVLHGRDVLTACKGLDNNRASAWFVFGYSVGNLLTCNATEIVKLIDEFEDEGLHKGQLPSKYQTLEWSRGEEFKCDGHLCVVPSPKNLSYRRVAANLCRLLGPIYEKMGTLLAVRVDPFITKHFLQPIVSSLDQVAWSVLKQQMLFYEDTEDSSVKSFVSKWTTL